MMILLYVLLWAFAIYGLAALIQCARERWTHTGHVIDEAVIQLDEARALRESNVRRLPRKVEIR